MAEHPRHARGGNQTPRILVLDNRDSFTFNLVQYLREEGARVDVLRSDRTSVEEVVVLAPEAVLVGPGPGVPERAGCTHAVVRELSATIPVLGVCLGHQAIATAFGGGLSRARALLHGRTSPIEHDGAGVFTGLPSPFRATRYHSLVVDEATLPRDVRVTARSADGEVMGLRHAARRLEGVQFHPEAIESEHGHRLLANFVDSARVARV